MSNMSFLCENKMKTVRFAIFLGAFLNAFWGVVGNVRASVFLDFNESDASGTIWPGWVWCDGLVDGCVSYNNPGWYSQDYALINNTKLPRVFRKSDYGNYSLAEIDNSNISPSTSIGSSMHVYDTGAGAVYQPSWWIWGADTYMEDKGIATYSDARLSMYAYLDGLPNITNPDVDGYNFEWGTYTCWPGGGAYGEDCPTESANGHWYHQITMATEMWVHILWDKHPTHRRSVSEIPPNNPTLVEYGRDYFAYLYASYMQFQQSVSTPSSSGFWIDELIFVSTSEMVESDQNDESITSLWIGYQPSDNHWEIGWNDVSSLENHDSEYEVRWSYSPITNENWQSASVVQPIDFVINNNHIHKSNTWKYPLWTRFYLPEGTEDSATNLYFAVKDVSIEGGLYNNSPSALVHTIDYSLQANNLDSTPPSSPSGLNVL